MRSLTGTRSEVAVTPTETVLDLKKRIQVKDGWPVDEVVLIYIAPGKVVRLDDSRTFASYGIVNDRIATVEVFLRFRAGVEFRERKGLQEAGIQIDVNSIERFDGG